jgi:hypothetical protein
MATTYKQWEQEIVKLIKERHLIKNTWKESKFRKLFNDGYSVGEAFRIWFLNHAKMTL